MIGLPVTGNSEAFYGKEAMHIRTSEQPPLPLGLGGYTLNWGVYFTALHDGEEERNRVMAGVFRRGEEDGDGIVYGHAEEAGDPFLSRQGTLAGENGAILNKTAFFRCFSVAEQVDARGRLSVQALIRRLDGIHGDLRKAGLDRVRAIMDMDWITDSFEGVEDLMIFSALLQRYVTGKPWLVIGLLDVTRVSGVTVLEMLRTHPLTLSGYVLLENPFHTPPERWLAEHAPDVLESMRGPRP